MMKKIIAIVLMLACAITLFSCGGKEEDPVTKALNDISDMYNAVAPSMVYTKTTRDFGSYSLVDESTLKVGMIDGFAATVLVENNQQLRDIESGSKAEILDPIEPVTLTKEYHEEYGVRVNGGKWNADGEDFAPMAGDNALNITKETIQDFKADDAKKTYEFTVLAANTETVFGIAIESDVKVVIEHSGADIVSVKLTYTEVGSNKKYPEINVTIEASYSYESQMITID